MGALGAFPPRPEKKCYGRENGDGHPEPKVSREKVKNLAMVTQRTVTISKMPPH